MTDLLTLVGMGPEQDWATVMMLRLAVAGMLIAALAAAVPGPARAQLGTSNNPPPQHLFNFGNTPPKQDTGLGSMADRRRALAKMKHAPVR